MANYEYFLGTDIESARRLTGDALGQAGYAVQTAPNGSFTAQRGSVAMTVLFGGLAGSKFRVNFPIDFFVAEQQSVVRLGSQGAGKALGGALGVSRSNAAFRQLAQFLGESFTRAGLLANSVANG